jgi:hypothetical protein
MLLFDFGPCYLETYWESETTEARDPIGRELGKHFESTQPAPLKFLRG